MVTQNNKVCSQCKIGTNKIISRRKEIDAMNKKAKQKQAVRKQSRVDSKKKTLQKATLNVSKKI